MWVSRVFVLFIIYSLIGWLYETTFTTVRDGRWENRGFLYGPICPIYGTGAVAIAFVASQIGHGDDQKAMLQIFIIGFFGSAVLEYVTSWTLEKLFHAVWWDYSMLPFNIQGRTSLFTSVGFGIAGIFIVRFLAPSVEHVTAGISDIAMECLALLFMGLLGVDIALTATALVGFAEIVSAAEENFNERMELMVRKIHRPALRRVSVFRMPGVNKNRLDKIRKELAVRIQESGNFIARRRR